VASTYLVYRIGKENFHSGLLPALIFAIAPLHVIHSHYATVDVACLFFVLFAFLFLGRYYHDGGQNNINYGALLLGLGTATKYYPAIFFLPMLYFIHDREKHFSIKAYLLPALFLFFGFVAGCPFSIIDFPAFISRFVDRLGLIVWSTGNATVSPHGWTAITGGMISSLTAPLFLSLLPGIFIAFVNSGKYRKTVLFWASFPAAYALFLGTWKIISAHYLMPLIPFFILIESMDGKPLDGLRREGGSNIPYWHCCASCRWQPRSILTG